MTTAETAAIAASTDVGELVNQLRDPLHAVMGLAELIADDPEDASTDQLAKAMLTEAHVLSSLVNQLTELLQEDTGAETEPEAATAEPVRHRVMVVDDSPVNQILTGSQIEKIGYTPHVVGSGAEALTMLSGGEERPDLILMDWHMPEMDGLETARRIRALEGQGELPRIPIVALTARAMSGDREECIAAGMDDFLAKPASLEDLRSKISEWMRPSDDEPAVAPGHGAVATRKVAYVNEEVLAALTEDLGDETIVFSLIATFLQELPERVRSLAAGASSNDVELVRRASHTLKSTSAMLGAEELATLARMVEETARAGTISDTDIAELTAVAEATATTMQALEAPV